MTVESITWDVVPVGKPDDVNVVIGQAHFIKTVDDLHEALGRGQPSPALRPGLLRGIGGPRLVRRSGNDEELANPVQVLMAQAGQGRVVVGVVDGGSALGEETTQDIAARRDQLRAIGYEL